MERAAANVPVVELAKTIAAVAVIAVQLAGPVYVAYRELWSGRPFAPDPPRTARDDARAATKGKRRRKLGAAKRDDDAPEKALAPALAPLRCTQCQAPVPLLARAFPCPHCRAPVEPRGEYVRALAAKLRADDMLARAERMWRRSRIVCSRPVTWSMGLSLLAWTAGIIAACVHLREVGAPGFALVLPGLVVVAQLFFGFGYISGVGDGRKELPPVPPRTAFAIDAAQAACAGCHAPLVFGAGRLASTCGYCLAESYRAALAQRAEGHEAREAITAESALMDQIKAHQAHRFETFGALALVGVAVLFYGAIAVVGAVGSALGF